MASCAVIDIEGIVASLLILRVKPGFQGHRLVVRLGKTLRFLLRMNLVIEPLIGAPCLLRN